MRDSPTKMEIPLLRLIAEMSAEIMGMIETKRFMESRIRTLEDEVAELRAELIERDLL